MATALSVALAGRDVTIFERYHETCSAGNTLTPCRTEFRRWTSPCRTA
jgi:hypothetical protein